MVTGTPAPLLCNEPMSRRSKRLTKKDRRAELRAQAEALPKLSETMLQFAKPLLDTLPGLPSIDELRQLMTIVTVVWNLPLYEQRKNPQAAAHRATFDLAMEKAPPPIAKILSNMLYSRLTTYAHDPRLGFVDVVEDGDGRAQIVATAALTDE
jgi:hypothetical protein